MKLHDLPFSKGLSRERLDPFGETSVRIAGFDLCAYKICRRLQYAAKQQHVLSSDAYQWNCWEYRSRKYAEKVTL